MFILSKLIAMMTSLIFLLTPQYKTVKQQTEKYIPSTVIDDVVAMITDKDVDALVECMSKGLVDSYDDITAEAQQIMDCLPDEIDADSIITMDLTDFTKQTKMAKAGHRYAGAYYSIACYTDNTLYVMVIGQQYIDTSAPDELGMRSIRLYKIDDLVFDDDFDIDEDDFDIDDDDLDPEDDLDDIEEFDDLVSKLLGIASNPLVEISADEEFDGFGYYAVPYGA